MKDSKRTADKRVQATLDTARGGIAQAIRGCVSAHPAYYAMFYAALGLLASKQLGTSKRAGVLSLFGQHFVKTGEFPDDKAVYLGQAFDLRQK